jgi:hypothetical protein
MGEMFQNASSLKPNCPGMIIGRCSVFYADRKSKMAATTGHSINTGPYRENAEISSSLKLLHWLNLNCASIIGRSFTNFVFFMLIVIPRWLPVHSFYIGPIGFFYNQVNDTGSWEPLVFNRKESGILLPIFCLCHLTFDYRYFLFVLLSSMFENIKCNNFFFT